jgi:hypothetical protein
MRKIRTALLVAVLGTVLTTPALAQLRGGLIAGATYSKMSGDFIVSSDFKWNWFAGAYLELQYRENVSLEVELNYVKKGGEGVTENTQNIDLDIGYVEVPILATYLVTLGDKWRLGLYGGGAIGVPVTCDVVVEGSSVSCVSSLSSAKTEWLIPVGGRLGYELPGGSRLGLDVRYSIPLSETLELQNFRVLTWQFLARWSTTL